MTEEKLDNAKDRVKDKVEKLFYAKKAVLFCLENENGSVDFKGIDFWGKQVDKLRNEIKEEL